MFKFLVLSALVAVAAAAPSNGWSNQHQHQHWEPQQPQHVVYHQQLQHQPIHAEYAHVGSVVKHVPVATSHQSRTDYHSKPIVQTVLAPVEYIQPVVHHQVHQAEHHYQHQPQHYQHQHQHQPIAVAYSSLPEQHIVHVEQPAAVHHVYTSGSVQHHGGHHKQLHAVPVVQSHSSW